VRGTITVDLEIRRAFEADASGLRMVPDAVARPADEPDVVEVLRHATAERLAVTVAGAQSSTTGASITDRGVLLSMRGYDRILDIDRVTRTARVQCGALVSDVKRAAAECGLTWAPDPTSEAESTVGGAIACNASGPRTLWYGPTRRHVRGLRVALADGRVLALHRAAVEKNTAGYPVAQDPVDWFIGSEGTLGIVLEAELALVPRPTAVIGLAVPFASECAALEFVAAARETVPLAPRCIEYFDTAAAAIAESSDGAPGRGDANRCLVYAEQVVADGETREGVLDGWLALSESRAALTDDIQVFEGEASLARARAMRHAVPAAMNERGAQARAAGGRKVSTDWAVPYRSLPAAVAAVRAIAGEAGLSPAVTYGHAGNGHPHQNYIACDARELDRTEQVVGDTLRHIVSLGGTIAAEHGIGKLKRRWLPLQLSSVQLDVMRALKHALDPSALLAPGNIL
jgi:FAD/FMN-containing dehydrogenase